MQFSTDYFLTNDNQNQNHYHTLHACFSYTFSKSQVIARNSDCFFALFSLVVIVGTEKLLKNLFSESHLKTALFAGMKVSQDPAPLLTMLSPIGHGKK